MCDSGPPHGSITDYLLAYMANLGNGYHGVMRGSTVGCSTLLCFYRGELGRHAPLISFRPHRPNAKDPPFVVTRMSWTTPGLTLPTYRTRVLQSSHSSSSAGPPSVRTSTDPRSPSTITRLAEPFGIPQGLWGWRLEPRSSKVSVHPLLKLSKLTPPKI